MVERVNALLTPFEDIGFDPFDRRRYRMWGILIEEFRDAVERIEGEAKYFINASFQSLRSAESAFDMLLQFEEIPSRDSITKQLNEKYNDVLDKFCEEVAAIGQLFQKDKDHPPRARNQPPVAGSILWARSLFLRIKKTVSSISGSLYLPF